MIASSFISSQIMMESGPLDSFADGEFLMLEFDTDQVMIIL